MNKFASMAVAGLVLAGSFTLPAAAAGTPAPSGAKRSGGVGFSYGCNSATFTNSTGGTININYGTASSGDATAMSLPAGASKTVTMKRPLKNFGYTASSADGVELVVLPYPGVDLTARCGAEASTKTGPSASATTQKTKTTQSPSRQAAKPEKESTGGLANTGR